MSTMNEYTSVLNQLQRLFSSFPLGEKTPSRKWEVKSRMRYTEVSISLCLEQKAKHCLGEEKWKGKYLAPAIRPAGMNFPEL